MIGLATWLVWSTVETADDESSTFTYVDAASPQAAVLGVLADNDAHHRGMVIEQTFAGFHEKREARARYRSDVTWRLEAPAVAQ